MDCGRFLQRLGPPAARAQIDLDILVSPAFAGSTG